jgi:hypothetical protein
MLMNITDVQHVPSAGFMVLAALQPRLPSAADLHAPGGLSALLSHDAGVSWPDRRGVSLMHAVLAEAGTVALVFETAADAAACRARLAAENRA